MALDWLPDATRDPHPRSFPWQEWTNPKGCLHTTEGSSWPTYQGWTVMPHATILPTPGKGITIRQHLPFSQGSFALRHTRAQPTNGDYVFQFELVGTCDPAGPRGCCFWPGADDAVLLDLYRKVIKPMDDAYVIPFRAPVFDRYPQPAVNHRMTDAQFDTYSGWHGHSHVPQNDHADPGAFPWDRLVKLAGQHASPLPVDGVLSPDTIRRWQTVLNALGAKPALTTDGKLGPATWAAVQHWLGHTPVNGVPGRDTIRDLERRLGVTVIDGTLGRDTVRALQRWLNAQPANAGHHAKHAR